MATAQGAFSRTRTGTRVGAGEATGTSTSTSSLIGAGEPTGKGSGTEDVPTTSVTTAAAFGDALYATRASVAGVVPATTTRAEAGARIIGRLVEGHGAALAATAGTPTPTPSFRGRYGTGLGGPSARTRRNGRPVSRTLVVRPIVRPPVAPVEGGARPIADVGRVACLGLGRGLPYPVGEAAAAA